MTPFSRCPRAIAGRVARLDTCNRLQHSILAYGKLRSKTGFTEYLPDERGYLLPAAFSA
jgi:hypothetical protein